MSRSFQSILHKRWRQQRTCNTRSNTGEASMQRKHTFTCLICSFTHTCLICSASNDWWWLWDFLWLVSNDLARRYIVIRQTAMSIAVFSLLIFYSSPLAVSLRWIAVEVRKTYVIPDVHNIMHLIRLIITRFLMPYARMFSWFPYHFHDFPVYIARKNFFCKTWKLCMKYL